MHFDVVAANAATVRRMARIMPVYCVEKGVRSLSLATRGCAWCSPIRIA
jgi:hypothetical protein